MLPLDVHQQFGHGGGDGNVQRGHRLIRNDHGWVAGERPGYADALLLPAGQLAWAPVVEITGQLDGVQQLHDHFKHLVLVTGHTEFSDDPPDLVANGLAWVQRVRRILKNHLQRADLFVGPVVDKGF